MFELNEKTGRLRVVGVIGQSGFEDEDAITPESFAKVLNTMDGADLEIVLNSEGGSIRDGISIYNMLKDYDGKITVVGDALVASIATVVAMAADEVQSYESTTWMVHKAWTIAMGNSDEFRTTADVLDKLDGDLANVYAKKTGKDAAEWMEIMAKETYMNPTEAMEMGMVDEILPTNQQRKPVQTETLPEPVAKVESFPHREKLAKLIHARRVKLQSN